MPGRREKRKQPRNERLMAAVKPPQTKTSECRKSHKEPQMRRKIMHELRGQAGGPAAGAGPSRGQRGDVSMSKKSPVSEEQLHRKKPQ